MSNIEESNSSLTAESNFDKKEYQREYMRKKREAEKLKKEQAEDRSGGVDASEAPVGPVSVACSVPMTKTDAKFEVQRPGYWIYQKEVIKRECWKCGGKFETRLEMNKFCSPGCKEGWLSMTFGKLRSNEKKEVKNEK